MGILNNADCKIAMDHCLKNAFSINLKRQNNAFEAKIFLGSSSSGPKRSAAHLCLVFPFPVTSLLVAFVIMMRGLLTVDIRYNIPCQAYNFSTYTPHLHFGFLHTTVELKFILLFSKILKLVVIWPTRERYCFLVRSIYFFRYQSRSINFWPQKCIVYRNFFEMLPPSSSHYRVLLTPFIFFP